MPRILYCRFDDCREAYVSTEGKVPKVCPACNRAAHWTTENPVGAPQQIIPAPAPPPFELTDHDRKFLKVNRIKDDWPPPANTDDGA